MFVYVLCSLAFFQFGSIWFVFCVHVDVLVCWAYGMLSVFFCVFDSLRDCHLCVCLCLYGCMFVCLFVCLSFKIGSLLIKTICPESDRQTPCLAVLCCTLG